MSGAVSPTFTANKISEIDIDVDKDWQAFGITNLKHLAEGMARGDVLYSDGTRLVRLPSSSIGSMLTTHDMQHDPTWSY